MNKLKKQLKALVKISVIFSSHILKKFKKVKKEFYRKIIRLLKKK